jgi:CheY-like chemotaxis protein
VDKVLAAVDDLFFAAKIRGAAQAAGRSVEIIKSRAELEAKIGSASLLIIDLDAGRLEPIELIRLAKSLRPIPIVGFLSHVEIELKRQAEQLGCDQVLPRSAFSQKLPQILNQSAQQ